MAIVPEIVFRKLEPMLLAFDSKTEQASEILGTCPNTMKTWLDDSHAYYSSPTTGSFLFVYVMYPYTRQIMPHPCIRPCLST